MGRISDGLNDSAERLVAELTVTAHGVALRHARGESFVELQLALWEALRRVVKQEVKAFGQLDRLEAQLAAQPEDRLVPGPEDHLCCCT